jgi:hypothetical protein
MSRADTIQKLEWLIFPLQSGASNGLITVYQVYLIFVSEREALFAREERLEMDLLKQGDVS